jgi:hypothetical protein
MCLRSTFAISRTEASDKANVIADRISPFIKADMA